MLAKYLQNTTSIAHSDKRNESKNSHNLENSDFCTDLWGTKLFIPIYFDSLKCIEYSMDSLKQEVISFLMDSKLLDCNANIFTIGIFFKTIAASNRHKKLQN